MELTIYSLKTCDTCKKAIKALQAASHDITIVDVRADGVPIAVLEGLLAAHGPDAVVNKKSTTWRGLDDEQRARSPLTLLQANPTLLKRPVIIAGQSSHIGWGKDVQAALGV